MTEDEVAGLLAQKERHEMLIAEMAVVIGRLLVLIELLAPKPDLVQKCETAVNEIRAQFQHLTQVALGN